MNDNGVGNTMRALRRWTVRIALTAGAGIGLMGSWCGTSPNAPSNNTSGYGGVDVHDCTVRGAVDEAAFHVSMRPKGTTPWLEGGGIGPAPATPTSTSSSCELLSIKFPEGQPDGTLWEVCAQKVDVNNSTCDSSSPGAPKPCPCSGANFYPQQLGALPAQLTVP
jgi:hypothetical protein